MFCKGIMDFHSLGLPRLEQRRKEIPVSNNTKNGNRLLTTQQLPEITGYSESFFEKGRVYGYGPAYVQPMGKGGRVNYWLSIVLAWLGAPQKDPEGSEDE